MGFKRASIAVVENNARNATKIVLQPLTALHRKSNVRMPHTARLSHLPLPRAGRLAPKNIRRVAALHSGGPDPKVGAEIHTYRAKEYVNAERVQLATMRRGE